MDRVVLCGAFIVHRHQSRHLFIDGGRRFVDTKERLDLNQRLRHGYGDMFIFSATDVLGRPGLVVGVVPYADHDLDIGMAGRAVLKREQTGV